MEHPVKTVQINKNCSIEPKRDKLQVILREKVNSGEYQKKIPGERALAEEYQVNVKTINKAVSALVQEGLLYREKGKGTFAREKANNRSSISIGIAGNVAKQDFFRGKFYVNIIEGVKKIIDEKGGILSYQAKSSLGYHELFRDMEIVDGILIFNPHYCFKDELRKFGQRGYSYIVIGSGLFFEEGINYVGIEEIEDAAMAVSALLKKGHKKIGLVNNKLEHLTYDLRQQGYKSALENANIEINSELIYFVEQSSYEVECERFSKWLEQNDLSAIFFASHFAPMEHMIDTLRKVKGENVDVALYDDFIDRPLPDLHYLAIKQPLAETGRTATLKLLDLISGKEKNPIKIRLTSELIAHGIATGGGSHIF